VTRFRAWKLLDRRVLYQSQWAAVELNAYFGPLGSRIDDYLIIRRPPFVLVVAERDDEVLMIEQYRPATERTYLCLPAGYLQDGETALVAAERELNEETGFSAHSFRQVSILHPLPGYVHSDAYVVRCVLASQEPRNDPDGEVVNISFSPWRKVLLSIQDGTICEMQAVAALLVVQLERQGQGA